MILATDVKWIKITTDIFDDEKILLIESLPDAYAIITVWFKLLCLAGKQNNSGVFMMGQMPYTDRMLSTIFRMKESTVTMALQTFEQFGMVEIVDGVITIPNWNKHQTLDAYEKKKERDRLYQAERRANQRALIAGNSSSQSDDVSDDESSRVVVSDKEEEKEIDIDIDKDKGSKNKKETSHTLFDRLYQNYIFDMPKHSELLSKMREWITYKTERKEGYKEQGMKSLLRQVENNALTYGDKAVIELIDECMASGWKGIIFDRLKNRKQIQTGRNEMVPEWMDTEEVRARHERQKRFLAELKDDLPLQERAEQLKERLKG